MMHTRPFTVIMLVAFTVVYSSRQTLAREDDPNSQLVDPTVFERVLGEIRREASSNDWTSPDWRNELIENWVNDLADAIGRSLDRRITLPVSFNALSAFNNPNEGNALLVLKNDGTLAGTSKVSRVNKSVVLAEGNIDIAFAEDSVVIASGAARISHAERCVVLAGHYVHISHDGSRARIQGKDQKDADDLPPSVVLAGDVVDISHAYNSVVSARRAVVISHANHVTFLNSPHVLCAREANCRKVNQATIPFFVAATTSPLPAGISITQTVTQDQRELIILTRNGVEYVWRPSGPLKDEHGTPIPELEAWQISFLDDNFAMLTNGQEFVIFPLYGDVK